MTQYSDDNRKPAAKIVPNRADNDSKKIDKQVRDLSDLVKQQQETIDRMHRDIVRLRTAINEVSARIK